MKPEPFEPRGKGLLRLLVGAIVCIFVSASSSMAQRIEPEHMNIQYSRDGKKAKIQTYNNLLFHAVSATFIDAYGNHVAEFRVEAKKWSEWTDFVALPCTVEVATQGGRGAWTTTVEPLEPPKPAITSTGLVLVLVFALTFAILLLAGYLWFLYNSLNRMRYQVKNGLSQILVHLTRRHDLMLGLVECVRGFMKHEHDTLEDVVRARSAASSAVDRLRQGDSGNVNEVQNSEAVLSSTLARLLVVIERYPELKANREVSTLMKELTKTEDILANVRQSYNNIVTQFNIALHAFPAMLFSRRFGFTLAQMFEVDQTRRQAIEEPPSMRIEY
jgi:LemA protein